ncbi:MAG: hypothetical protein WCF03_11400 [Nitrososphaeraceae archaeon]
MYTHANRSNNYVNAEEEVESFYQLWMEVYGSQLVQAQSIPVYSQYLGVKTHSREERKKGSNRFFTIIIVESFIQ